MGEVRTVNFNDPAYLEAEIADEKILIGDRVTWNVYSWHTGRVVSILEKDVMICDRALYNKGDLVVLCDNPWFEGQTVVLNPGRTVRRLR